MLPCVDGDNDEYCDNCHKPMCEHVYGDWTYMSADTHNHVCTLCGKEEIAGHDYKVTSHVDATCEAAGSTKYYRHALIYYAGYRYHPPAAGCLKGR